MGRRQLVTTLAVGVTAAILVAVGIRQADAGLSNPPLYYPPCATGEFTTQVKLDVVGDSRLDLTGWVAPCRRLPFDPAKFAWEVRTYSDAGYLHRRKGFENWSDSTFFTDQVPLRGATRAVCLAYGGGASKRIQCVKVTPPEAAGPWTVEPLATDDHLLDVTD